MEYFYIFQLHLHLACPLIEFLLSRMVTSHSIFFLVLETDIIWYLEQMLFTVLHRPFQ